MSKIQSPYKAKHRVRKDREALLITGHLNANSTLIQICNLNANLDTLLLFFWLEAMAIISKSMYSFFI